MAGKHQVLSNIFIGYLDKILPRSYQDLPRYLGASSSRQNVSSFEGGVACLIKVYQALIQTKIRCAITEAN